MLNRQNYKVSVFNEMMLLQNRLGDIFYTIITVIKVNKKIGREKKVI